MFVLERVCRLIDVKNWQPHVALFRKAAIPPCCDCVCWLPVVDHPLYPGNGPRLKLKGTSAGWSHLASSEETMVTIMIMQFDRILCCG